MSDDLYDGPCEAGCISFHGGERKHHKDCGHYPHSLTKVNADRIEELEAQNKMLRDQMRLYYISVEALSEIKASVDGKSDQLVVDIIYGLLDEIAKTKKGDQNE